MKKHLIFGFLIAGVLTAGTTIKLFSQSSEQQSRTYKIRNNAGIQAMLNDVVRIENIDKLQSRNFPEDFEIQVRNISKKPIYFMNMGVTFRKTVQLGTPIGFTLKFGSPRLIDIDNVADKSDISAKPGELLTLKPHPGNVSDMRGFLEKKIGASNVDAALDNVLLFFQVISHGDGTGYIDGEFESSTKTSQNIPSGLKKSFLGNVKSNPSRAKGQLCDRWKLRMEMPECLAGCPVNQTALDGGTQKLLCSQCVRCGESCCNQDFVFGCDGIPCFADS